MCAMRLCQGAIGDPEVSRLSTPCFPHRFGIRSPRSSIFMGISALLAGAVMLAAGAVGVAQGGDSKLQRRPRRPPTTDPSDEADEPPARWRDFQRV